MLLHMTLELALLKCLLPHQKASRFTAHWIFPPELRLSRLSMFCQAREDRLHLENIEGNSPVSSFHTKNTCYYSVLKKWKFMEESTCLTSDSTTKPHSLRHSNNTRLCTWTSPDGQQRNQTDCILCSQRRRSSI